MSIFLWLQPTNDKGCFFFFFCVLLFLPTPLLLHPLSLSQLFWELSGWKSSEMRDPFGPEQDIAERGITFSCKCIFSPCVWTSHQSYVGSTTWQRCQVIDWRSRETSVSSAASTSSTFSVQLGCQFSHLTDQSCFLLLEQNSIGISKLMLAPRHFLACWARPWMVTALQCA